MSSVLCSLNAGIGKAIPIPMPDVNEGKALLVRAAKFSGFLCEFLSDLKSRTEQGKDSADLESIMLELAGLSEDFNKRVSFVADPVLKDLAARLQATCRNARSGMNRIHFFQPIFKNLQTIEAELNALDYALYTPGTGETRASVVLRCHKICALFGAVKKQIELSGTPILVDPRTTFDHLVYRYRTRESVMIENKIF